jgi:outer membrane protein assembly factor BamB
MTQQPDHFHPKTVDEQIERLTHDMEGQQETISQELVQHLRHFYQKQGEEKSVDSLDHAWERITHTQAYLTYEDTHTEQQAKRIKRIGTMKILPDSSTDMSYDNHDLIALPTRRRRVSRFMQNLAAVLLVGLLLGAFLILFRSQHVTTGGSLQTHSLVVANSVNGTIHAINPESGAVLWQYATGTAHNGILPQESDISVQGKVVYAIEGNQTYALNALNGTLLWKKTLDAPHDQYSMLQVDNGVVYVSEQVDGGGAVGHMYALQASNGTVLWHHQTEEESLLTAANGIAYTYVNTVSGNTLIKAFGSHNGQFLWQYAANAMTGIVSHDTLYISAAHPLTSTYNGSNKQDKSLLALNAKTGQRLWSQPLIDYGENPLVVMNNMIIVGSLPKQNSYHYCAYNTDNGSQMWCSGNATVPAITNTTRYMVMDNTLYILMQRTNKQSPIMGTCQLEARSISPRNLIWSYSCPMIRKASYIVGSNGNVFIAGNGSSLINLFNNHGHIVQKTLQFEDTAVITSLAAGSW